MDDIHEYEIGSVFEWGSYLWKIEGISDRDQARVRCIMKTTGLADKNLCLIGFDHTLFYEGTFLSCSRHSLGTTNIY